MPSTRLTRKKYLALFLLSFSSGLPVPLLSATLQAWLTSENIPLVTIGLFSAVTLPYGIRFLWAPLVDRYQIPRFGIKSWVLFSQLALIASLWVLAPMNPSENLALFFVIALFVGFVGATQDIAIDALRAELLSESERGPGASASVAGSRIAFFISGALALLLADHTSWENVYRMMAALTGVGLLGAAISPRMKSTTKSIKTFKESMLHPFRQFLSRKDVGLIIGTIVLYKLGFAMANSMTVPFFLSQGFSKTDIGSINKTLGLVFTLSGAALGGYLIKGHGAGKSLYVFGWLQIAGSMYFAITAAMPSSFLNFILCVSFDNFCGGMATAALFAFILSKTEKDFIATQMGIMGSLLAVTRTLAGMPTGFFIERWGWPLFFLMTAIVGLPALLLVNRMAVEKDVK